MRNNKFIITVDKEAHASYLKLTDAKIHYSKEVYGDVIIDYDKYGDVRGIELLGDIVLQDISKNKTEENDEWTGHT